MTGHFPLTLYNYTNKTPEILSTECTGPFSAKEVEVTDGNMRLNVEFIPTKAGDFSGDLTIHTNIGDYKVNCKATATAADLGGVIYYEGFEYDFADGWIFSDRNDDDHTWQRISPFIDAFSEFGTKPYEGGDGLKGSDRRWYQTDYFSGTTKEEFLKNAEESWWPYMQFYCEYPSQSISPTDISYDHVAMGIWPDFNGEGYSLGGSVDNPDTFQGVIGLDIPMQTEANEFGVQDVEKTSVVVLIFNKADERIIAADKVSFVDFNKDLSKVESLEAENYYMPKGIYTISGLRLPDNTDLTTLPCGVYIIDGHKRIIR